MQKTNARYFTVLVSGELPSKETSNFYRYQKSYSFVLDLHVLLAAWKGFPCYVF